MALSKVNFNSLNVTPAASKAIKFNSNNNGIETGDVGGSLVLISEQTASSSSTIDFTSGIDSTYKEYIFKFINIEPATDGADFSFQVETGTNSDYNQTITSSYFRAYHHEADNGAALEYVTGKDLAQSTNFQVLAGAVGNGADGNNDECASGEMHLFEPSSTTFVKHFTSHINMYENGNSCHTIFVGGYINDTTAITRVRFKFSSGNIATGTIKMYGVV